MRLTRISLGLVVAVLFAVLVVRNVDLAEVVQTAKRLPFFVLAASLALVVAGYSMRAWRWQIMLGGTGVEASYQQASSVFFAAFALNNLLPLRAGDVYRCIAAARFEKGAIAQSLATILTERMLDLAALTVLLSVVFLLFLDADLSLISIPIAGTLLLGFLLLGLLIAFPDKFRRVSVGTLALGFDRLPILVRAGAWMEKFTKAIENTLSKEILPIVVTLTVLAWSLELAVFVLVGSALSGELLVLGGIGAGALGPWRR